MGLLYPIIDLHTHILPRMDDGSRSLEMSLEMLKELSGQGVATVCCTSHYYAAKETIPGFVERRTAAFHWLSAELEPELPALIPGAETAWFPNMSRTDLAPLCLGQTRTLLVEMPFTDWSRQVIEEIISLVLDKNHQVILVHPERFCFTKGNQKHLERLAELPIGFQVNADTLLSWRTRKQGLELLEMSRFPLLGSDCHNMTKRAPHLSKARAVVEKYMGTGFLQYMDVNAARAVTGQEWED